MKPDILSLIKRLLKKLLPKDEEESSNPDYEHYD